MDEAKVIYQARDAQGRLILVTDPQDAPAELRDTLVVAVPRGTLTLEPAWRPQPVVAGVHLPSLALGLALGVTAGALLFVRKKRPLLRVAVLAAGLVLMSGLYLGVVRRMAALSDDRLATPQDLLEEARAARDAANAATRKKEEIADALTR